MTQSGRGEEPSAQPAREGIVLPSDGGEPLLPGMIGGQGGQPTSVPATPPTAPPSAPPGGQSWGTPWGPEQTPPVPSPQPPAAPGQPGEHRPASPGAGRNSSSTRTATPVRRRRRPRGVRRRTPPGVPSQPLPPEGVSYGGGAQGARRARRTAMALRRRGAHAGAAAPAAPAASAVPSSSRSGRSRRTVRAVPRRRRCRLGQGYGAPVFGGALPPAQQAARARRCRPRRTALRRASAARRCRCRWLRGPVAPGRRRRHSVHAAGRCRPRGGRPGHPLHTARRRVPWARRRRGGDAVHPAGGAGGVAARGAR